MTKKEREERLAKVERLKGEANSAKEKLMRIADEIEALGVTGEAVKLYTIIGRLERWQNM